MTDVGENDNAGGLISAELEGADEVLPRPLGPISKTPPPIVPIGQVGGVYYFISAAGEQRDFKARDLVRLNITSLFGGATEWLCENFPVFDKQGQQRFGQFGANEAAEWLMLQCGRRDLFNPNTPLRRRGVWRNRDNVVAHFGGRVWYRGNLHAAGLVIGGMIYPAISSSELPDFANPADTGECAALRAWFNAWDYAEAYDADLLFGYLGMALLGTFPHWRVHAMVIGERGSGKSTLGEMMSAALGPQGTVMTDYSEPGIRQSMTNEARALWLDEGESHNEDKANGMSNVIALMRQMSGGAGARVARGSSGGTAVSYLVTGSVMITCINPPALQPQDRSRILQISINKQPGNGRSAEDMRLICADAAALSPRLRARALMQAGRFDATCRLFREEFIKHGCDGRQADMFAALLAGRSLLLDNAVPDAQEAVQWGHKLRHRLRLIMLEDSDQSDAQLSLNHLLDASCEAIRDGIKRSIGQIVAHAMRGIEAPENDKLVPLGLRIIDVKGAPHGTRALFVANDHLALKRIYHNTPWANKGWRSSLLRLPGVMASPVPVQVGRKSRGLLIPKEMLPVHEQDNEYDISPAPPDG